MKLKDIITIIALSAMFLNSCASGPEYEDVGMSNPITEPSFEPVSDSQTAIPINPAIPVANRVAGRPGYVFNPYNQNIVEVNGLASGTKVQDPLDPNPSNIFLVP